MATTGAALMQLFTGTLVQGLIRGCIVALLAVGVTIVYRSTRIVNLAQGGLATFNAYLYYQVAGVWGVSAVAALFIVLPIAAGVGIAAELVAVRPLVRADARSRTVGTIGLLLIVQGAVLAIWGSNLRVLKPLWSGSVTVGGVVLTGQDAAIVAATIVVGIVLASVMSRTRAGLALVAVAQDPTAARLLGIGPRVVSIVTFALAGVLSALAGILATPLLLLNPFQMTLVFVIALGASLAGGFDSLPRTIGAGLLLGVIQSLVGTYVPVSGLPQAAGFLAVLVALAIARRRGDLADVLRATA